MGELLYSININLACLLKSWPGNWKCGSAWSKFSLFGSFRWFFSLKLMVVSDLPVYCLLHNIHSTRYVSICFSSWVCYVFWRFCVWLCFQRCWLITLVYRISCLTQSCRTSKNHFDHYFNIVVFCLRLFSCQEYPAGFYFIWRLL